MTPFAVMDCVLLSRMSGLPPAVNLRELRDRLAICSEDVIYHHFCETWLRPTFDDPEFRNDFALWAKSGLHDRVLAERLAIIDPYEYTAIADLRQHLLELIEERLSELQPWVPMARAGLEFNFMQATTVVFDTGERIGTPKHLADAVGRMTNGSIYFHFLEARRRPPLLQDDFGAWLTTLNGGYQRLIGALSEIDIYFSSLAEIRSEIVRVLAEMRGGQ